MTSEFTGLSTSAVELKVLFQQGESTRGTQSANWEDYSGWTLPGLYTQYDRADGTEYQHDYQSLGAQAVNHLANKISMTLFAPARPFFRLELTPEQSAGLESAGMTKANIETLTATVEKNSMRNMEKVHLRTAVIQAIKALIVLGNTLVFFPPDSKKAQVYNLRDYVVTRDCSGTVLQIITRDRRVVTTLPQELKNAAKASGLKEDDKVELYTGVTRREDGKFFVKQELDEVQVIASTFGEYPEKDLPWLALTWNLIRGEQYGIGLVEEYAGDFHAYSQLSESVLDLSAIAADIKILVNPMGQTDVDTLNESESGTYVYGRPDDVAFLQLEKLHDLSFVNNVMETYARRIGSAFLLNSQVTRDAERVTAEEIRLQANELENSLGGVYSRLAEELQQPLARRLLANVDSQLSQIEPVILTGVESLSRNSEHEQMMLFLNDLTLFSTIPEQLQTTLKLTDLARILANNRGIEHDKFMKSDAEIKQDREDRKNDIEEMKAREAQAEAAGQTAGQPAPPMA